MPIKYIYIGCEHYGLQGLLEMLNGPHSEKFELVGIISLIKEDRSISQLADILNVPLWEKSVNCANLVTWIRDKSPDWGFMLEYPKIIPQDVIELFNKGILNFHPSDLPELRGGAPLQGLLLENKPLVISCHLVSEKYDEGPIIKKTDPVFIEGMHQELLYQFCSYYVKSLVRSVMQDIANSTVSQQLQQSQKSSYLWYKELEEKTAINWEMDSVESIERKINCSHKKHGLKSVVLGKEGKQSIVAYKAFCIKGIKANPGEVIKSDDTRMTIGARGGVVIVDLRYS